MKIQTCQINVNNKQSTLLIADLATVMQHIIMEGQEEAFQSEIEYLNAQNKLLEFMNMQRPGKSLNLYHPF